MGAKGNLGIALDLDAVPCRETGMTAYEMLLSESQERMLMVLDPAREKQRRRRSSGNGGSISPSSARPRTRCASRSGIAGKSRPICRSRSSATRPRFMIAPPLPRPSKCMVDASEHRPAHLRMTTALVRLIASPDLCSKRWIYEQYDHLILGNTVQAPGGDAAVIRIGEGPKGLALTTDVTQRYCLADPFEGGKQAVAEAWRNLTAVGALPRAITDNLNFGNPEKPEIMGQLIGCIEGIGEACRALDFPVVSGNVSLYNESSGRAISPTPAIGGVGLVEDVSRTATLAFKRPGETILLIGETEGWLGQSLYLREICGREEGAPPPVDLAAEKRNGDFVRGLIESRAVTAVHDISDGGLAVALAEMAIAGGMGASIDVPAGRAGPWLSFRRGSGALYCNRGRQTPLTRSGARQNRRALPVKSSASPAADALTLGAGAAILLE